MGASLVPTSWRRPPNWSLPTGARHPDVSLSGSYGISRRPSKGDDLTIGEWSQTVARAEQHHHAWKGIHIGARYSSAEWAHDTSTRNLTTSVRQLKRTINPPIPNLGHDFGISM